MPVSLKTARIIIATVLSYATSNPLYAGNIDDAKSNTYDSINQSIDGMNSTVGRLVLPSDSNAHNIMNINGIVLTIRDFNLENLSGGSAIKIGKDSEYTINVTNNGAVIFQDNHSLFKGGVIFNEGNVSIGDNASYLNNGAENFGGAVDNSGHFSIGNNANFKNNTARSSGGALRNFSGTASIGSNANFSGNTARRGGAIANTGSVFIASNAQFFENSTIGFGAAIYNFFGDVVIDANALFSRNTANLSGGAIFNGFNSSLTFNSKNGCTTLFSGNTDASGANSIAFNGDNSTLNLNSSVLGESKKALLDMRDPMRASGDFETPGIIAINKNDDGLWALGGSNDFTLAQRTNFNINSGSLYLYAQDEVSNASNFNSKAMVDAGILNLQGIDTIVSSTFVLGAAATLIAGGANSVILGAGSIILEDGASIRGGSASQSLGGQAPTRIEQGGATSLTLSANGNTQLNGLLKLAALDTNDRLTLNAVLVDGAAVGGVFKNGAGTVILNSASTYSGNTNITAGTLEVNGSLLSDVFVATMGRLSGRGRVGNTVVNGAIAPGNSIGTLSINGNYTQEKNSTYEVEISPNGASDLINISGNAIINGGIVSIIREPGLYMPQRYTILSAVGSRTGMYDTPLQTMPFLNFELTYDTNRVFLEIVRSGLRFFSPAITKNEVATANTVERLGMGNLIYNAVLNVGNASEARLAFNALSGEVHALELGVFTEDSRYIRGATLQHLDEALAMPTVLPVHNVMKNNLVIPASKRGLWMQTYGARGNINGDANVAEVSRSNRGFVIGADTHFGPSVAGLLGGYSQSRMDIDKRASSGKSDDYSLGLYTARMINQWSAKLASVYTWHQLGMNRSVVFPNFYNRLKSDYTGHTAQVFAQIDYDLGLTPMRLKPFVGAAYVYSSSGRWAERGGAAALTGDNSFDAFYTSLGLKQSMDWFKRDNKTLTESLTLAWRHAHNHTTSASRLRFISGGAPFTIFGAAIANDALLLDAGLTMDIAPKNFNLRLAYIGQFAKEVQDHGVSGSVAWSFD